MWALACTRRTWPLVPATFLRLLAATCWPAGAGCATWACSERRARACPAGTAGRERMCAPVPSCWHTAPAPPPTQALHTEPNEILTRGGAGFFAVHNHRQFVVVAPVDRPVRLAVLRSNACTGARTGAASASGQHCRGAAAVMFPMHGEMRRVARPDPVCVCVGGEGGGGHGAAARCLRVALEPWLVPGANTGSGKL